MFILFIFGFLFQAFVNSETHKQLELQQRYHQEHLKRQQEHIIQQQHKIQELQVILKFTNFFL